MVKNDVSFILSIVIPGGKNVEFRVLPWGVPDGTE